MKVSDSEAADGINNFGANYHDKSNKRCSIHIAIAKVVANKDGTTPGQKVIDYEYEETTEEGYKKVVKLTSQIMVASSFSAMSQVHMPPPPPPKPEPVKELPKAGDEDGPPDFDTSQFKFTRKKRRHAGFQYDMISSNAYDQRYL